MNDDDLSFMLCGDIVFNGERSKGCIFLLLDHKRFQVDMDKITLTTYHI